VGDPGGLPGSRHRVSGPGRPPGPPYFRTGCASPEEPLSGLGPPLLGPSCASWAASVVASPIQEWARLSKCPIGVRVCLLNSWGYSRHIKFQGWLSLKSPPSRPLRAQAPGRGRHGAVRCNKETQPWPRAGVHVMLVAPWWWFALAPRGGYLPITP
jgi:hypothetical protein